MNNRGAYKIFAVFSLLIILVTTYFMCWNVARQDNNSTQLVEEILQKRSNNKEQNDISNTFAFISKFGLIPIDNKDHNYEIDLINSSSVTVRILKVVPSTPCCTSVEKYPEMVRPGENIKLHIVIKGQGETGPKNFAFFVSTGLTERETKVISLRGDFYSKFEILPNTGNIGVTSMNKSNLQSYSIVARSQDKFEELPKIYDVETPVAATYIGSCIQEKTLAGLYESKRKIEVSLPAMTEIGQHRALLVFKWMDGSTKTFPISWEVAPPLMISPSKLLIPNTNNMIYKCDILIQSIREPFKLLAESCPIKAKISYDKNLLSKIHKVHLEINTEEISQGKKYEVWFRTDHPVNEKISLNLYSQNYDKGDDYD